MLFEEVQNSRDGRLLLLFRRTEGASVHVNVKSAGAGLVGEIAHVFQLVKAHLPRHFVYVIIHRHWMSYKLKPVVDGTVVFCVDVSDPTLVCELQYRRGVGIALACFVYFKLDAEVAITFAEEYRLGLVVVFVDYLIVITLPVALTTVRIIVCIVTGIIPANYSSTFYAGSVVVIIAVVAQRQITASCIAVEPDSVTAIGAHDSFGFETGRAK